MECQTRLAHSLACIKHCIVYVKQMSSSDRVLLMAFREIGQMAERLHLPKMIAVSYSCHSGFAMIKLLECADSRNIVHFIFKNRKNSFYTSTDFGSQPCVLLYSFDGSLIAV